MFVGVFIFEDLAAFRARKLGFIEYFENKLVDSCGLISGSASWTRCMLSLPL
jgi:hypothetical protein